MQRTSLGCAIAAGMCAAVFTSNPAGATTLYALTNANQILRVDDAAPGTVIAGPLAITGLQPAETLVGIDIRPADETLFGVGSTSRLYTIDRLTGVATAVTGADGTLGPFTPALNGTSFGVDFNPVADRLRVVSDADQNLRLAPADGRVAGAVDTSLAYGAADPNFGINPAVVASAYTNNFNGTGSTTLYGIDVSLDILVIQSPPNNGTLGTVGPLGVNATAVAGFDIVGGTTARAVLTVGGVSQLYTINLTTGAATLVANFTAAIVSIAAAQPGYAASTTASTATFTGSAASQVILLDSAGGLLRHNRRDLGDAGFNSGFDFDSSVPGDQTLSATTATININGLGGDDTVVIGSAASRASVFGAGVVIAVNGGDGHDVVRIDDSTSSAGRSWTLGTSTVTGIFGGVSNLSVESVEIAAGGGDDGFSVGSPVAATTIRAGSGADVVVFANGGGLNGGLLDGEAGNDVLDLSQYRSDTTFEATAARELYLARASGAQEPGPLSNSPASGRVTATLDPGATALAFAIPYRDLTGAAVSGAHFHNAKAGINGGIVRGLTALEQNGAIVPAGTFAGTWASNDAEPFSPTLLAELRANRVYFNLHTTPSFPSGELRGQLLAQGLVGLATGTAGVRNIETLDITLFGDGFE